MAARSVVGAITVPTLILWVLVGVSVVCAGQQASHTQPEGSHGCLGVENEARFVMLYVCILFCGARCSFLTRSALVLRGAGGQVTNECPTGSVSYAR